MAPIDVAPCCAPRRVAGQRTAILTSATIPASLPERVGLDPGGTDSDSTWAARSTTRSAGILYNATHLPDPRPPDYTAAVHDELEALITAAGGRTLALFTSYKALGAAVDALRARLPFRILEPARPAQDRTGRSAFAVRNRPACSPPRACSRASTCPAPRSASSRSTGSRSPAPTTRCSRRGAKLPAPPRSATSTCPAPPPVGPGRRPAHPHGRRTVVWSPILDPRLNKAGYRWDVVNALPPMRRTRHRAEAEAFLREITGQAPPDRCA